MPLVHCLSGLTKSHMRFKFGCGRVATFLELYSTCAEFKWGFRGSFQSLQARGGAVSQTNWWPLHSTSPPLQFLLIMPLFDADGLSERPTVSLNEHIRTDNGHRSIRCKCENCQGRIHDNKRVHKTAHKISPFQYSSHYPSPSSSCLGHGRRSSPQRLD